MSLEFLLGKYVCTIDPNGEGGCGKVIAVHTDKEGRNSIEVDWGMEWLITPDTVLSFRPDGKEERVAVVIPHD